MQEEEQQFQEQLSPSLHNLRKSYLHVPGVVVKQQITSILTNQSYVICECKYDQKVIVYDVAKHQNYTVKVHNCEFFIVQYPPYMFACIIGQYIYLWEKQVFMNYSENQANRDIKKGKGQVFKAKISKLNVKSVCKIDKGLFIAGNLRSSVSNSIKKKKTIYFLDTLDFKKKNKPLWEIQLPRSDYQITLMKSKAPYLVCCIYPKIHVVHPAKKSIVISLQLTLSSLNILDGKYATNSLNILSFSKVTAKLCKVDIQSSPIYGVQIHPINQEIVSYCLTPNGNACYLTNGSIIYEYNLFTNSRVRQLKTSIKQIDNNIIKIYCKSNQQIIILISTQRKKMRINNTSSEFSDSLESGSVKSQVKTETSSEDNLCYCAYIVPIQ